MPRGLSPSAAATLAHLGRLQPHLARLPIKLNPLLSGPLGARPSLRPLFHPPPVSALPPGYTANVTSINSGMGHHIPAIVLKKKRKKRNRKGRGKTGQAGETLGLDPSGEDKTQTSPEDPRARDDEEDTEATEEGPEEEDESVAESGEELRRRRSEPDLTKLCETELEDGDSGAGPTDSYDLLQSAIEAGALPMLHGSCPDLSEAQRGLLDELIWDMDEDPVPPASPQLVNGHGPPLAPSALNPFHRHPPPPTDYGEASDTDTEVVMARMQRSLTGATSHLAPITVVDPDSDYELSSAPVFNAVESAACEGSPSSPSPSPLCKLPFFRTHSIGGCQSPGSRDSSRDANERLNRSGRNW